MTWISSMLALVLVAPAAHTHGDRTIYAAVKSVGDRSITVSILHTKSVALKDRKIRVSDATHVYFNGHPALLSALAVGENVMITLHHGIAITIQASNN